MFRVIVLVLGLAFSSAQLLALPSWIIPSPISIALTVGQWMLSQDDSEEVYYIRVQSVGDTESDARKEAFRLAIDQAVGSLLVSETEIYKDSLERHDVLNYSSGYIHNFEYVNVHRDANGVTIQIDVWVTKSKIAERITLGSKSETDLDGEKISETFKSLHQQKQTGDKLLNTILQEYPHKAYQHRINSIEYATQNRTPVMLINFSVRWKPEYVVSLAEVMGNVGEQTNTGILKTDPWNMMIRQENCVICDTEYYHLENHQVHMVNDKIHWGMPAVHIKLVEANNNTITETCGWYDNMISNSYAKDNLYDHNGAGINFNVDRVVDHTFGIDLTNINIDRLDRAVLSFIKLSECKTLLNNQRY